MAQLNKSFYQLMIQCFNLKSKLFLLLDHFNWMDKQGSKYAFFFNTADNLVYLNNLPTGIDKNDLNLEGLGRTCKLKSSDVFSSTFFESSSVHKLLP